MNRWWLKDPRERYWIEITDREDIGTDLLAPVVDRAGKSNWRYSLIAETRPGDIVFHFDKERRAIVGRSEVCGGPEPATLKWVARGTYARRDGATAEEREAIRIPLRGFSSLQTTVSRELLRQRRQEMLAIEGALREKYGNSLYFPFFVSPNRGGDPNQGYFFKMPADLVHLLGLQGTESAEPTDDPEEFQNGVRRLRNGGLAVAPNGQRQPRRSEHRALRFYRDPCVAAYVLQEANGVCELCNRPAPFRDTAGEPFLEVHHVRMLAAGGSDTHTNAVALCPNCHRACHLASDRAQLVEKLLTTVLRLRRE